MAGESRTTVLVAGVANLAIAVAKCVAGLLSGSTALLAESAHSVADTLNQVFLLTALHRSRKPPDDRHPFGYGLERYFWSLLAAIGIFVLGAGFSVLEGVEAVLHPEPVEKLWVIYVVLAVSFAIEFVSWLRAVQQLRREAAQAEVGVLEYVRETAEPAVKTVAFEDTAALIGLLLAAIGVTLAAATGVAFFDGGASIAIGALLVVVAWMLGRENKSMLIGQALPQHVEDRIKQVILGVPGVDGVLELLSLRTGPDEVLIVVRVDLDDAPTTGAAVEHLAEEVNHKVTAEFESVRHLFLDPTPAPAKRL